MPVIFLTATGAGSWPVPADWNNLSNSVECVGGGGNTVSSFSFDDGGGGGAYSKKNNVSLTPLGTASYFVGAAAQDTWFKSTGDVLAKGGQTNGSGGQASQGVGDVKFSGGDGGPLTVNAGVGGGGAAGPHGDGGHGGAGSDEGPLGGGGGGADNGGDGGFRNGGTNRLGQSNPNLGSGGDGREGSVPAENGSTAETLWTQTSPVVNAGPGGGGGGGTGSGGSVGSGALYGGGAGETLNGSANGAQGIIIITYDPAPPVASITLGVIG